MQPLESCAVRWQIERIDSIRDTRIDLSSVFAAPAAAQADAPPAAAVATGAAEDVRGLLHFEDYVTVEDFSRAREEAAEKFQKLRELCEARGRRPEDAMREAAELALGVAAEQGTALRKGLDNARADGRRCRMFVVTGVEEHKAVLRPVRLQHMRGLRAAARQVQPRGATPAVRGTCKASSAAAAHSSEAGGDAGRDGPLGELADFLYGPERDEKWVRYLLEDAPAGEEEAQAAGAEGGARGGEEETGWKIYDEGSGLESDDGLLYEDE